MTTVLRLTETPATDLVPADGASAGNPMEGVSELFESDQHSAFAGSWYCSQGQITVEDYPFDEVCFITEGKVGITDLESGKEEIFTAGQAFICRKGTNLLWTVYEDTRKYYVGMPAK